MADTGITQLQIIDTKVGTGAEARPGRVVRVHYTGWLYDASKADKRGKKFDSSKDRNEPFEFPLGGGQVIAGWDQGVAGMKVGGTRVLTIPPAMGYGARGAGGVIPPNATLVFEVELLGSEVAHDKPTQKHRITETQTFFGHLKEELGVSVFLCFRVMHFRAVQTLRRVRGCSLPGVPYAEQLLRKQARLTQLLGLPVPPAHSLTPRGSVSQQVRVRLRP